MPERKQDFYYFFSVLMGQGSPASAKALHAMVVSTESDGDDFFSAAGFPPD